MYADKVIVINCKVIVAGIDYNIILCIFIPTNSHVELTFFFFFFFFFCCYYYFYFSGFYLGIGHLLMYYGRMPMNEVYNNRSNTYIKRILCMGAEP